MRCEYQCQIASGRIPCQSDPMNAARGKCLVADQHVVRGRRKWVFGSKPIVRDKRPCSRPRCDMAHKMAVGLGRSEVEPATMQVEDRLAWPGIRRMYPESWNAAEGVCFECHVVGWQHALHENVKLRARVDSRRYALGGTDHGAHGSGDRSIFGVERMEHDRT